MPTTKSPELSFMEALMLGQSNATLTECQQAALDRFYATIKKHQEDSLARISKDLEYVRAKIAAAIKLPPGMRMESKEPVATLGVDALGQDEDYYLPVRDDVDKTK